MHHPVRPNYNQCHAGVYNEKKLKKYRKLGMREWGIFHKCTPNWAILCYTLSATDTDWHCKVLWLIIDSLMGAASQSTHAQNYTRHLLTRLKCQWLTPGNRLVGTNQYRHTETVTSTTANLHYFKSQWLTLHGGEDKDVTESFPTITLSATGTRHHNESVPFSRREWRKDLQMTLQQIPPVPRRGICFLIFFVPF